MDALNNWKTNNLCLLVNIGTYPAEITADASVKDLQIKVD
jgi:hypothetical protein